MFSQKSIKQNNTQKYLLASICMKWSLCVFLFTVLLIFFFFNQNLRKLVFVFYPTYILTKGKNTPQQIISTFMEKKRIPM